MATAAAGTPAAAATPAAATTTATTRAKGKAIIKSLAARKLQAAVSNGTWH